MLQKVALNLFSFRDVTLEERTFKVLMFGVLYLNVKVLFLAEESMIVLLKSLVIPRLNKRTT